MSKLPNKHQFTDLSDYGRPFAKHIAKTLLHTKYTPIDVTISFIISGLIAIVCILYEQFWLAGFFLILKSILDAADGELARQKQTPSYTGRYLDSISDLILNALIISAIWFITDIHWIYAFIAFLGIQLQGTLYNYYYVILRNIYNGDTTSRVIENTIPVALKGEKQKNVTLLFGIYTILYGGFDKIIYNLDKKAEKATQINRILMTAVSSFGLGFQLLLISIMLSFGLKDSIIPFFSYYTLMIFVFITIRKNSN